MVESLIGTPSRRMGREVRVAAIQEGRLRPCPTPWSEWIVIVTGCSGARCHHHATVPVDMEKSFPKQARSTSFFFSINEA